MTDRRLTRDLTREWVHGLVALTLGLFLLGAAPNLTVLRSAVDFTGNVLSVPERPAVWLRGVFRDLWIWSRDKNKLRKQLTLLEEENARLQIANSLLVAERLKTEMDARMEDARITLREPHSWWNEFRINKGFNNGISIGLPVFQNGFLVGRVSSVSSYSSWVEPLSSSSSMIPVVIEENRELGVVVGDGNGTVLLTYIPEGRGVEKGMKVSTALVNERLPSGIPVGYIQSDAEPSGNGYVTYKITPGASLSTLYTVSVLRRSALQ